MQLEPCWLPRAVLGASSAPHMQSSHALFIQEVSMLGRAHCWAARGGQQPVSQQAGPALVAAVSLVQT